MEELLEALIDVIEEENVCERVFKKQNHLPQDFAVALAAAAGS